MIAKIFDPLRFEDEGEECSFREYAMRSLLAMQIGCFIAGFLIIVCFLCDRGVDPDIGEKTLILRILILPTIVWGTTALTLLPSFRPHVEAIALVGLILIVLGHVVIHWMLRQGFDYAIVPLAIIFLFAIAFIRFRLPFYIAFFAISWLFFAIGESLSPPPPRAGLLIANNIWIANAVALGMIAVVTREIELRRQFRQGLELEASRQRIDDFLGSVVSPEEILRLKQRDATRPATKIAISYRRSDSDAMTGRMRDRLVGHFGAQSVFMDIHDIPASFDFRPYIEKVLAKSDILLAVIGPNWLGLDAAGQSRLAIETDPVRLEIEIAQNRRIPIIPVLVGGASMPQEHDLPPTLRDFAYCQAVKLEAGQDFGHHMHRLVQAIDALSDIVAETHAETRVAS